MEVKYTMMLTQEFCVGWISTHKIVSCHQASLIVNKAPDKSSHFNAEVYELRLDIIEKNEINGDGISRSCCLIFAVDIEPVLKHNIAEGEGKCLFCDI